jgi:hypothetical protein
MELMLNIYHCWLYFWIYSFIIYSKHNGYISPCISCLVEDPNTAGLLVDLGLAANALTLGAAARRQPKKMVET